MSPFSVFQELQDYVGFGPADQVILRALHPGLAAEFPEVSELFYARILEYPPAREVLERGESSVGRLKHTLVGWMDQLFQGPWDEAYVERRARIGRVHVRIGLPQHYMFGGMNLLRRELSARIRKLLLPGASAENHAAQNAVSRMLDLELAIMLQTYREDLEAQKARSERMATFGQVVASIGHELRNPLGVAESSVFLLEKRVGTDPAARKHLQRIGEQIAAANGIVSSLLDLVRDRPMNPQPLATLGGGRPGARPRATARGRPGGSGIARRDTGDGRRFPAPAGVRQSRAERGGGLRRYGEGDRGGPDGRREGRDLGGRHRARPGRLGEGPALRAAHHHQGQGVGLGLALVKRIAERHGGTIGHVTPAHAGRALHPDAPRGASVTRKGSRRYLVVDDNEPLAENLAEILETSGAEVDVEVDSLARAPAAFRPAGTPPW
jgi:signal transduction histidine kinase